MRQPGVSVVIPTHNRGGCVGEAIRSVLGQKVPGVELIVVDDGSTDDTPAILESFGPAICRIRQDHAGVSAARNAGIRVARGEWIAFLDSDDYWLPGKLAAQLRFFSENPDMKICQTEEIWLRNGERLNPRKYHQKPRGHCFPLLLERCLISPSAVIIHREVLDRVGLFDESLPACEDFDLWLRIGCRYAVGLVDKPLIVKRGGHPDQLSASVPFLDRYRIRALVKLLSQEPLGAEQQRLAFEALDRKCRIYGEGCRKWGRVEEAEAILRLPGEVARKIGLEGVAKSCSEQAG